MKMKPLLVAAFAVLMLPAFALADRYDRGRGSYDRGFSGRGGYDRGYRYDHDRYRSGGGFSFSFGFAETFVPRYSTYRSYAPLYVYDSYYAPPPVVYAPAPRVVYYDDSCYGPYSARPSYYYSDVRFSYRR